MPMTRVRRSFRLNALLCTTAGLLASRCSCFSPVENDEPLEDQQILRVDDDEISRPPRLS